MVRYPYCSFPSKCVTAEILHFPSSTSKLFKSECRGVDSVGEFEMGKIVDYLIFSIGLVIFIIFSTTVLSVHFSMFRPFSPCSGLCGIVFQATETIWLVALLILSGLSLAVAGFYRIRTRQIDDRAGTFLARRVSGAMGEVGDLDFHIPPTDDAPANLYAENGDGYGLGEAGQAGAVPGQGANSEFNNPFEF